MTIATRNALGLVLLFTAVAARGQELRFQLGGFTDYTTSARVYPASRDADPTISTTYTDFGGFLSLGGDLRIILSGSNSIGLTVQHISHNEVVDAIYGYNSSGNYVGVPVSDGFSFWIAELSGYFDIPIVGKDWSIYLGGGPELSVGKRDLKIGDDDANTPSIAALGIQVVVGVSYKFAGNWGARWEMKFRSPEINTASSFSSSTTTYDGLTVALPQLQYGKVDVDGTNFMLGLFYEF